MITLIYGDDLEKIEESIVQQVAKQQFSRLPGQKIKIKELEEELLGESLFGEEKTFIIESIFKNKSKKELLELILKNNDNLTIILTEYAKLNKRDLSTVKFDKVLNFELPQVYFKFLDDLYPPNARVLSLMYRDLLKTSEPEQIFYSMIKRVRALIAIKSGLENHSEISRLAPWQFGKLKRQAAFWTEEGLTDFYKELYEIEKKMKSSNLPLTLEKYIDMTIKTCLN